MYKQDLALNNLQGLIYHKTQQTKKKNHLQIDDLDNHLPKISSVKIELKRPSMNLSTTRKVTWLVFIK